MLQEGTRSQGQEQPFKTGAASIPAVPPLVLCGMGADIPVVKRCLVGGSAGLFMPPGAAGEDWVRPRAWWGTVARLRGAWYTCRGCSCWASEKSWTVGRTESPREAVPRWQRGPPSPSGSSQPPPPSRDLKLCSPAGSISKAKMGREGKEGKGGCDESRQSSKEESSGWAERDGGVGGGVMSQAPGLCPQ